MYKLNCIAYTQKFLLWFDYFAYAYKINVLQLKKLILILTEQIIMYRITHTKSDVELVSISNDCNNRLGRFIVLALYLHFCIVLM